jgi:hypothetical protein
MVKNQYKIHLTDPSPPTFISSAIIRRCWPRELTESCSLFALGALHCLPRNRWVGTKKVFYTDRSSINVKFTKFLAGLVITGTMLEGRSGVTGASRASSDDLGLLRLLAKGELLGLGLRPSPVNQQGGFSLILQPHLQMQT